MGTILVGAGLLAVVALAVRSLHKDRKTGGCGNGCSGCAMSGQCHKH